jgi:GT2 family glycosyltransferase
MSELLRQWWPILPSTVVMRCEAFERCGGFCEDYRGAAGHEDVDLWLRARDLGEFIYLDRPLVRYHVGSAGDPMLRYQDNFELFTLRTRARYGGRSRRLLLAMRSGYANAFAYRGLRAMGQGDIAGARRSFRKALGYRPLGIKNALRLARTFLPLSIARLLSGRTARADHPIGRGVADNTAE